MMYMRIREEIYRSMSEMKSNPKNRQRGFLGIDYGVTNAMSVDIRTIMILEVLLDIRDLLKDSPSQE